MNFKNEDSFFDEPAKETRKKIKSYSVGEDVHELITHYSKLFGINSSAFIRGIVLAYDAFYKETK